MRRRYGNGKAVLARRSMAGLILATALAVSAVSAGTALTPAVTVQAEQTASISGTIASGTTDSLLKLNTTGGQMLIKIDSSTDLSAGKLLLTGKTVTVEYYRGSDAYLHASKITGATVAPPATVDTNNTTVVSGTIADGTTDSLLKLNTAGGQMLIKMDSSTDLSGCKAMVIGKTLTVTVGRGSDAYMHAVKIADGPSSSTTNATVNASIAATQIQGVVADETSDTLLKLNTNGGQMLIKIDSGTDYSQAKVLVPGLTVGVDIYRGDDAYNHAKKIVGFTPASSGATIDSNQITVNGTVAAGTTESILLLATPNSGTMKIKLDQNAATPGVLTLGKSVTLNVARGSDAYMHAVSFNGGTNNSGNAAATSQIALAQGTVAAGTNESVLFLATSGGTMQFKIDSTSNLAACQAMIPGNYLAVAYYRGADAWNHVSLAVSNTAPSTQGATKTATATVTGTVGDKTTSSLLYLNTSAGEMQIKIDNDTDMGNVRSLLLGKTIKVSVARGADAYMHAITISY